MDFMTVKVLSSALLPPLDLLLMAALGLLLLYLRRSGGLFLLVASLVSLFVLSTPVVGTTLRAFSKIDT